MKELCKYKWWAFIGICTLEFIASLDFTIVNTILPAIQKGLGSTIIELQWVMNIYFIVLAAFMAVAGKLSDIFGYRRLYYLGSICFVAASLIACLSINTEILIFARFIQGIGAAIIFPVAASLLIHIFPEKEVPKVLGFAGALCGLGYAIAPVLGGVLTSLISWRAVFFINIPIFIVGMCICIPTVPRLPTQSDIKIDWIGFLFFIMGIAGLVTGIIGGAQYGWLSLVTISSFIAGAFGIMAFVINEFYVKTPLLELHFFARPLYFSGTMSCMIGGIASAIVLFFDPLYLDYIRNESAMATGFILLAMTAALMLFSCCVGKVVKYFGIFNSIIIGLFAALIAAVMHLFFSLSTSFVFMIISLGLVGIAWAAGNTVSTLAAHASVPKDKIGVALGMVYTLFDLGASIALAVAVVLFKGLQNIHLNGSISAAGIRLTSEQTHRIHEMLAEPTKIQSLLTVFKQDHGSILLFYKSAFLYGFHGAMWSLILIVSISILCVLIARIKYKKTTANS